MSEFDMYKRYQIPVVCVSAKNIPEFYELIERADTQARELSKTLNALNAFNFDFEFSAVRGAQRGEMDSASSEVITIPTK